MNAALFMLTTAWMAGADAAPAANPPAANPPGVVAPGTPGAIVAPGTPGAIGTPGYPGGAPIYSSGSSCGGGCSTAAWDSCNDCCGGGKHGGGLFSRFRSGGKHRGNACCESYAPAAPACCAPAAPMYKPVTTCAPAPTTCCAPAPTCGASSCCDTGCGGKHSGGGLFSRFRSGGGLFSKHNNCCIESGCNSGCGSGYGPGYPGAGAYPGAYPGGYVPGAGPEPIGPPKETPKKMPADKTTGSISPYSEVTPVVAPSRPAIEVGGPQNPFDLARRYANRAQHATDYTSLTGQLFFVHADGGYWVLRYAPLSEEDRHGGSVVLARDANMDGYREGDLVTVQGSIIQAKTSLYLGGPLYRVTQIALEDRARD